MLMIREIGQGNYFTAADQTTLCELLHPVHEAGAPALPYSIAHAMLPPGAQSLPHCLHTATEVYIILAGAGRITIDGETADVRAGHVILIPPSALQSLQNPTDKPITFLCLVSPPWAAEDEAVSLPSVTVAAAE